MNWLQKQALNLLGLNIKNDVALDKQFYDTLYQWRAKNSPVPLPDSYESYVKNGYNKNIFVYSCVKYISSKAADIPWKLCRYNANGEEEEVTNSPLLDLLKQPNNLQDWSDFVEQSIGYYLITGNTYNYKVTLENGLNKGLTKELYVLPSQYIEIQSGSGATEPIKSYDLTLSPATVVAKYSPDEIIHVKQPNYEWVNGETLYGTSPLKAGLMALNASNANLNAITNQNQNMGALGILSPENMGNLTEQQARTLENKIRQKVMGSNNAGKIAYSNMALKWQQLGLDARSMQLIEQHDLSRNDICMLYNLPSQLFNDDKSSTYNNVNEAKKSAYTDAILPALNKYIAEINRRVVQPYDETLYFKADTSNIQVLQVDRAKQVEWLSKAYWLSNQEKQAIMEVDVDETFPKYTIPSNLLPFDDGFDSEDINKRYPDY